MNNLGRQRKIYAKFINVQNNTGDDITPRKITDGGDNCIFVTRMG